MKASAAKLMISGLLAAGLLAVGPQVLSLVSPPVVHPPQAVAPPPGVRHLARVEDLVFEMTNQVRHVHGQAPLIKDDELRQLARAYSDDMLVRHFFEHTDPDGVPFDERISDQYPHRVYLIGENIWSAEGYDPAKTQRVAREIMDSWLTSPGHRENLLSPNFTHLGVGVSARQDEIRATQEFVRRPKFFIFGSNS
jgi:uncharacterized protein YkwD